MRGRLGSWSCTSSAWRFSFLSIVAVHAFTFSLEAFASGRMFILSSASLLAATIISLALRVAPPKLAHTRTPARNSSPSVISRTEISAKLSACFFAAFALAEMMSMNIRRSVKAVFTLPNVRHVASRHSMACSRESVSLFKLSNFLKVSNHLLSCSYLKRRDPVEYSWAAFSLAFSCESPAESGETSVPKDNIFFTMLSVLPCDPVR
mmetsp:Transcript_60566/g.187646  ORF Transcript_60566/g.187646 Transcript_60566/m.187646 type:complete len:207 (-) Transcript_60566:868-1488(-)